MRTEVAEGHPQEYQQIKAVTQREMMSEPLRPVGRTVKATTATIQPFRGCLDLHHTPGCKLGPPTKNTYKLTDTAKPLVEPLQIDYPLLSEARATTGSVSCRSMNLVSSALVKVSALIASSMLRKFLHLCLALGYART